MTYRPGCVPTGPEIITSRFDVADGYTYDGYVRTGGYSALRKALTDDDAAAGARARSRRRRCRAAAAPASRPAPSGGSCRPDVFPRYVVVNGDESEPGTFKDRLLMELDPHQLIEGVVLACYAVGAAQAFLYVRGEMALAQERIAQALNDAYAHNLVGRNILGTDFSVDVTLHVGRRRLHRRRGDGADREPRGRARDAPAQAAVLPGRQGAVPAADDRQQRRDAGQRAVDRQRGGPGVPRHRRPPTSTGHAHVRRQRARRTARACSRCRKASRRSACCSRRPSTAAASATDDRSRRSSPVAHRHRGSSTSTSTCRSTSRPSTRPARCSGPGRSS